ncbi:MAG: homocysteine S-methyltransferase family protein [Kiloniellales bacterium]|nr:homocysteine S-methyltransferase family protein [Kiloniellales bacterium]
MSYKDLERRLAGGGIVILDGGIGTELERRGVPMDPEAWCGPASLAHLDTLEAIHRDYIAAGADIVTANTYASSRLMLEPAGLGDRFEEINRAAVRAAQQARAASGEPELAVAGSLSHMVPMAGGTARVDLARAPDAATMAAAFGELAALLAEEGCELILLEMMYHPERMPAAFAAATATGLPVWAGFSARRGADGQVLSFASDQDIPFEETVQILADFDVAAAGVMHTPPDLIAEAVAILRGVFDGPLVAYPDSGFFKMPNWQFDAVISPGELLAFATDWVAGGVQAVGGCCGLSPEHIAALATLKAGSRA